MSTNKEMYILENPAEEFSIPTEIPTEEVEAEPIQMTEEEIAQFYEENKEAIDLMGGLDIFESLMNVPDDQFVELEPAFLQVFSEVLNEKEAQAEMLAMLATQQYDSESVQRDFVLINETIDTLDFLSAEKRDFLRKITAMSANKMEELSSQAVRNIQIPCEILNGNLPPTYAHDTDAGMDIISPAEYTINPGETIIIPTGIKCAIPEGYALLIQPRSGQSVKTKLRIANTPGLIDSGYRDEIGVIVENIEPPFKDIDYEFDDNGEIHIKSILHGQSYTIAAGQKFAQMRLVQVPHAQFLAVENVGEIGENRGGGFGSTGM